MPTNFPSQLDSFTNPQATDTLLAVPHDQQHANANDAIEALQAKVGVDGSDVETSLDFRVTALETAANLSWYSGVPAGDVNGVNTSFLIPATPVNNTLVLTLNGLELRLGTGHDFLLSGAAITMLYPPPSGSVLFARFLA